MRVKKSLYIFLALGTLLQAEFIYRVENSNFTLLQNEFLNYDRLRVRLDYSEDEFFSTVIVDGVNYYGDSYVKSAEFNFLQTIKADTSIELQTKFYDYKNGSAYSKIYRAYTGYEDSKNRVVAGVQNISMGVGRIWTPSNIFNPRNTYALEPDETYGVLGVLYTRHLSDTADITFIGAQKRDNTYKFASQFKSYTGFADIGLDVVSSDSLKMLAYEIEGNLADSGVEVRSEAAYIKTSDDEFAQGIVGADYAFVDGITLIGELLYSSKTFSKSYKINHLSAENFSNFVESPLYTAVGLSYSFNIFLDSSITYIESFNDRNSRYITPMLSYTLNDYNSFMIGGMISHGERGSEFGTLQNAYYFKWQLSF